MEAVRFRQYKGDARFLPARKSVASLAGLRPVVRAPRVAASIGALATGALALGAMALGALAIGRLAVGSLRVGNSRIRKVEVEDLEVNRLRVRELSVAGQPVTADPRHDNASEVAVEAMNPQPLLAVDDVGASSAWYQAVLGMRGTHGGDEYERLESDGRMVMQLHRWDAHDHPHLGDRERKPHGNGVLLWFQTNDFDAALRRIASCRAVVLEGPRVNRSANHREIWLRDPNGYKVVVAGRHGDLGSALE